MVHSAAIWLMGQKYLLPGRQTTDQLHPTRSTFKTFLFSVIIYSLFFHDLQAFATWL